MVLDGQTLKLFVFFPRFSIMILVGSGSGPFYLRTKHHVGSLGWVLVRVSRRGPL